MIISSQAARVIRTKQERRPRGRIVRIAVDVNEEAEQRASDCGTQEGTVLRYPKYLAGKPLVHILTSRFLFDQGTVSRPLP